MDHLDSSKVSYAQCNGGKLVLTVKLSLKMIAVNVSVHQICIRRYGSPPNDLETAGKIMVKMGYLDSNQGGLKEYIDVHSLHYSRQ